MLTLNYRDTKPIYMQIKDGLKKLVISGALKAEEKLPSVRELASNLAINPNTIQRAYRELEAEGYLYSMSGKGTFVSPDVKVDEERKEELWRRFDETVEELIYLLVSKEELKTRIEELEKRSDLRSGRTKRSGKIHLNPTPGRNLQTG